MFAFFLIFSIFIFLFGVIVGSFLNCVIYRLGKEETLAGRSYCPHCKHTLSWMDLVPVFSFLFLRGTCRYCRKKISWQYPTVEISTGLTFLLIFLAAQDLAKPGNFQHIVALCLLFYIASSLIIIFVYDVKHYLIPDKILFPAIAITFLYQFILNPRSYILNPLLAAFIASGFFLCIYLISRGKWMGFGDVKLAILLGLLLGFPQILVALFLSFLFGAIIGAGLMLLSKKGLKSEIPFAPFLIGGTFIALLFGGGIIHWYVSFFV